MDQASVRRPQGMEAKIALEAQAVIHVIVGDCQRVGVESARLDKNLLACGKASAGNRRIPLRQMRPAHVPDIPFAEELERFHSDATHSQHHTSVLHRVIRVEQARANRADLRSHCLAHELFKPLGIGDFDVIVQEHQNLAIGDFSAVIVDRREIEGMIPVRHAHLWMALQRIQILEHLRLIGLVVQQDNLKGPVCGLLQNTVDALPGHLHLVAGGNEDTRLHGTRKPELHAECALPWPIRNGGVPSLGPDKCLDRTLSGDYRVGLAVDRMSGRSLRVAPMV